MKQEFGWPAFFFWWIWAFVKRMWGVGFALLGILFVLILIEVVFEEEGSEGGVLLMLVAQFALFILVGVKGNDWRRSNLLKRGYKKVETLQAETPEAAIGAAAESAAQDEGGSQQDAPGDAPSSRI